MNARLIASISLLVALRSCLRCEEGRADAEAVAVTQTAVKPKELSLVRVNVTGQAYDYFRPWQKRAPFSKRALGAVLPRSRVLVTADLVANQNYVELERAEIGRKNRGQRRGGRLRSESRAARADG